MTGLFLKYFMVLGFPLYRRVRIGLPCHGDIASGAVNVEGGVGGVDIGVEPKVSYAAGQGAEYAPAYEGQVKSEQPPLVARHKLLAHVYRLANAQVGIFRHKIGGKAVAVAGYNAGHDKQ